MADYISREAAMSMPWANGQYDHEHANEHFICGLETYREWLEYVPAADVRPVVLCRDCRWWTKQEKSLQGRCELAGFYPTGEWFCANGERSNCGADMMEVKADG